MTPEETEKRLNKLEGRRITRIKLKEDEHNRGFNYLQINAEGVFVEVRVQEGSELGRVSLKFPMGQLRTNNRGDKV
jgi:hypothetical protein